MRKIQRFTLLLLCTLLFGAISSRAEGFEHHFIDSTLRLDYIFSGNAQEQMISLRDMKRSPLWAGRRCNLEEVPLKGNGDLTLYDSASGMALYKTSFSSLFQEWLTTAEAATATRSFEFTLLVPMPRQRVEVEVVLRNNEGEVQSRLRHTVEPDDCLIRDLTQVKPLAHKYLHRGGTTAEAIDVVIMAEGYTEKEMKLFLKDAQVATEEILSYAPFCDHREKFNFIAVMSPSEFSGASVPQEGFWNRSAVGSNFMTFYMERYLTTNNLFQTHDCLTNIPYEHIIILANTDTYGGGGIYNSYTLTTAHHPKFRPVVVHEFGHSFGGLGDEYFYETSDNNDQMHKLTTEPWEPNITTLVDFQSKWADLLEAGIESPSAPTEERKANYTVGLYEGGGYRSKGVFRPAVVCRMRDNEASRFCPVCERALEQVILHHTVAQ